MSRIRGLTVDVEDPLPPINGDPARYDLLKKETVLMTVLAQDPSVLDRGGPVRAGIAVPAERLQRGPRGHHAVRTPSRRVTTRRSQRVCLRRLGVVRASVCADSAFFPCLFAPTRRCLRVCLRRLGVRG